MKKWQNKKAKRKLLSMKQKQKLIGATSAMMMLGNLALAPIGGMAQTTGSTEPTSEVTLEETQDSTLDKLNSGELLQKGAQDGANQSGESTDSESIEQDLKQSRGTTQSPTKVPTKQRALTKNIEETRPTSGEYADGGKWKMDYTTGKLTLDGGTLSTEEYPNLGIVAPWEGAGVYYLDVKSVEFISPVKGGASCDYLFWCYENLTEIERLENFDTSGVTDMFAMFSSCSRLTNLNLDSFNTSSVQYMNDMFSGCSSLTNLNLENFDVSNVLYMSYMFNNCISLEKLNISNFNIAPNTNTFHMFYNTNLKKALLPAGLDIMSAEDIGTDFFHNSLKIDFILDGEPLYQEYLAPKIEGDTLLQPSEPMKKGYAFSGWFTDADLTQAYDFDDKVFENITLYAKWNVKNFDVTFAANGGSTVDKKTVQEGTQVTKPADPTRKGYTFAGWFTDSGLTKAYDFNSEVMGNTTLYAKWNVKNFGVTFDAKGGSAVAKKNVQEGKKVAKPGNPTRKGYAFAGWFTDTGLTKAYNFDSEVMKNTTLYAKWNVKNFGVTFDAKGGSAVAKKTVQEGKKVAKPGNPTRKGYTFAGWFTDTGLKKDYNFNSEVLKNTTLYAKWNVKNFGVTFKANGGSAVAKKTIQEGKKVAKPTPKRTGYSFVGWYTDVKLTKAYNFNSEVKGNITLYAKWKKQQGPAIKANYYVTITSKNYKTYSNFSWKKKGETKSLHNKTYKVKVHYNHGNGSRYLSLYDKNGKWLGYVNAKAAKKASGAQGIAIKHNKTVKVTKKNYQLHGNFSWKKKGTTNKWVGKKLKAKVYYNHHNGSRYYSLYDSKGKWLGYVNAKAVK